MKQKRLKKLLEGIKLPKVVGTIDHKIETIVFDSREVKSNSLFVAIKGSKVDGHDYINMAIEKGATAIILESFPKELKEDICYIAVENSAKALSLLACNFYEHPSRKIKLTGVTGTNGKTTTVKLLKDLFDDLGYKTGMLSTIENIVVDKKYPTTHTTLDPMNINKFLQEMVQQGCEFAFMEVSSHAIHQHRIGGLHFEGGIFTNISHDHLGYHGDMKEYIRVKKLFFDGLEKDAFAIYNADDRNGRVMVQNSKARKFSYSLMNLADFKGKVLENSLTGLILNFDGSEFHSQMIGSFNAENLLAVYACGILFKVEKVELLIALSKMKAAKGRFEFVRRMEDKVIGIVDYCHTPDALKKVLQTIQDSKERQSKIITVVGCGGDRDKSKRPKMARIGYQFSGQLILTSDNPRTEDPLTILQDMENGLDPGELKSVLSILDRKQAIKTACMLAQEGDVVLIAGKGHETYQEVNGVKHPFDDIKVLKEELGL